MKNAVIAFVCGLILLGIGTIMIVEKFSHEPILPRSFSEVSTDRLKLSYSRGKYELKRLWRKLGNKASDITDSTLGRSDNEQPSEKIIKWQDHNGVWHYEYESTDSRTLQAKRIEQERKDKELKAGGMEQPSP